MFMTLDVQRYAEQCLVHSELARTVLQLDRGPREPQPPARVIPFGMPLPSPPREMRVSEEPLIVSLGYVSEVKGLRTLILAFSTLAEQKPDARLIIAGPATDGELRRWREEAATLAPQAQIEIPGSVPESRYRKLLETADLAVQLRLTTNGEASAAVADCLAAGLPTIVTDLGWLGDLPNHVVSKVDVDVAPQQLASRMAELLGDAPRRSALAKGARGHAERDSFARVADAYLEALEL
jgi:glycosyltransferase involved in cell wall biosynthesis